MSEGFEDTPREGRRTGVFLLQMGGPRDLDEVEEYIRVLFSDKDLVRLPWFVDLFRPGLAKLVARRRSPEVREQYAKIGGGSPNNDTTIAQARGVERLLAGHGDYRCYATMTYTAPLAEEALQRALDDGCTDFLALSLFPQFSTASTMASLNDLKRACARRGVDFRGVRQVDRWGDDPRYLDLLAEHCRTALDAARSEGPDEPHLVVSAHGVPVSYVKRGDPYVSEVESTVAGLRARLPEGQKLTLAYQSRATPVKWVQPATDATLARLGREGERNLVVLPVSFVNDHIETLFEIDMLLRDEALGAGVKRYGRVPVFNTDEDFLALLRDLVLESEPARAAAPRATQEAGAGA